MLNSSFGCQISGWSDVCALVDHQADSVPENETRLCQFFLLPDSVATVLADGCWLMKDPEQTGIHGVVPAWAVQTYLAASTAPSVILEYQWFRIWKDR